MIRLISPAICTLALAEAGQLATASKGGSLVMAHRRNAARDPTAKRWPGLHKGSEALCSSPGAKPWCGPRLHKPGLRVPRGCGLCPLAMGVLGELGGSHQVAMQRPDVAGDPRLDAGISATPSPYQTAGLNSPDRLVRDFREGGSGSAYTLSDGCH